MARRLGVLLGALLVFLGFSASPAPATDYPWIGAGTGGNTATDPSDPTTLFLNPANWQEGSCPGEKDVARVGLEHAGTVNAQTTAVGTLHVYGSGGDGAFRISEGVDLAADYASVGSWGASQIVQTGGTFAVRVSLKGAYSRYELQGGDLVVGGGLLLSGASTGYSFVQTGGTNTVAGLFLITGASYHLDAGSLHASAETLKGWSQNCVFRQTGGANVADVLSVERLSDTKYGRYELYGGTLHVNVSLDLHGTLDFGGSPAALSGGAAVVNLAPGTVKNAGAATLTLGPGSLLIVAPGFDPSTVFAHYSNEGMVHVAGQTLVVGPDQEFVFQAALEDHVESAGTIAAFGDGSIDLNGGVLVSAGRVDLGRGTLTVENPKSGISGGTLSTSTTRVGRLGSGLFTHMGGTHRTAILYMGYANGAIGRYLLSSGDLATGDAYVGYTGQAEFIQTGGTHSVAKSLVLGSQSGGSGEYTLSAGGLTVGGTETIGYLGTGSFAQTGATHSVGRSLVIGLQTGSNGTFLLSGGDLAVSEDENIGWLGTASFTQAGGTHSAAKSLVLGSQSGGSGEYTLSAGGLTVGGTETIGLSGKGSFTQAGGTHSVAKSLVLGSKSGSNGMFLLSGGTLAVSGSETIGSWGTGSFTQTGGRHTVSGTVSLWSSGSVLTLAGGSLVVGALNINPSGPGLLDLASAEAYVEVSGAFSLGPKASLRAVDGATVHITGMYESAFRNQSCDEIALAGLEYLTVAFDGTHSVWSTFEVAGRDLGAVPAGFQDNFGLGALVVGGAKPARLILSDAYDNGNRSSAEALYLHDLTVVQGSTLDLRNLHLYYDGTFVNEGTIVGGWPIFVPEPATLALLALGGAAILSRRRRRPGITGRALPKKS